MLHWTYVGGADTISGNKIAQVTIDFEMEQYLNKTSNYGAPATLISIGCLRPYVLVGSSNTDYLYADDNSNPPVYLDN